MKREDMIKKATEALLEIKESNNFAEDVKEDLKRLKPFLELVPFGSPVAGAIEEYILGIFAGVESSDYEVITFFVDKIESNFKDKETLLIFKIGLFPLEGILIRFRLKANDKGVYLRTTAVCDNEILVERLKQYVDVNQYH